MVIGSVLARSASEQTQVASPKCVCRNWTECATEPVKTECVHYFCEKCALEHDKKGQRCAVCEKDTRGIFNTADEIIAKYKQQEKGKKRTVGGLGWGGWNTDGGTGEQEGEEPAGGGWQAE